MASSRVFVGVVFDKEFQRPAIGRDLVAGVRAGQVAGLAMAVALMAISSLFLGQTLFFPLQVIAASVLGDGATVSLDARVLVVGLLVHQLGPALVWGVVFGIVVWLVKPRASTALMMLGLVVGALSQIVDVYVLLPLLSGEHLGRLPLFEALRTENVWAHIPAAASWAAHMVFGFALSFYPWKYDPVARTFD
jgi:hypothetical protein